MTELTQQDKIVSYQWKVYKLVPTTTDKVDIKELTNQIGWFIIFLIFASFLMWLWVWIVSR